LWKQEQYQDLSYERNGKFHFVMDQHALTLEKYIFSMYWVAATITVNGQVGEMIPQNFVELIFTIFLMILNMTLYRW